MADEKAAATIIKTGLSSPITAIAMAGAIFVAGGAYWSVNNSVDQLKIKVTDLESRDREAGTRVDALRQDIAGLKASIAGIETSLRFLVEAQRRRPTD